MIPSVQYLGMIVVWLSAPTKARSTNLTRSCNHMPGDPGWPDEHEWAQLNETVGGRLIATVPQASVCHSAPYSGYNATSCAALQDAWGLAQTL